MVTGLLFVDKQQKNRTVSKKLPIQKHEDYQFFSKLFPCKRIILFQYQSLSLLKDSSTAKKWSQLQDKIFVQLIHQKDQRYKWSQLAKQLYIKSDKQFFRTPKQCRQRWLNHLDPNKCKQEWELKQDFVLITHVLHKGKKWAQISKLLKNRRNQHSIKNRYKSLITKQQKFHPQKLPQNSIVQILYKKYNNHFHKLKQNTSTFPSMFQKNNQLVYHQQENQSQENNDDNNKNQTFQLFPSRNSLLKAENYQLNGEQAIKMNYYPTSNYLDPFQKEDRQKIIRADMLLSPDPFSFLKQFFRSKDSIII